jgi:archaellum component FlaC
MPDRAMDESLIGGFLNRLKESGEGAFNKLSEQLLENPVFLDAMRRTLEAKGQVDRTISGTMDLVNLPSKNDVSRIVEELESMSARLGKQQKAIASLEHDVKVIKTLVETISTRLAPARDAD